METLLPILVAVPPVLAGIFETGVLDEIYNIDLTCGGRVGAGWGAKCFAFLERCLRVKQPSEPVEDDEGGGNDDHEHVSTTRSGPTSLFQESASASLDLASAVPSAGATDDDRSISPRLSLKGEPKEVRDALAAI